MDDGCNLVFKRGEKLKWSNVLSGGEGMTTVVRLSGDRDLRIETASMVYQNYDRNYLTKGVSDMIDSVFYRTRLKGWMSSTVTPLWFKKRPAFCSLPRNRQRVLFVDSCNGHVSTDALMKTANKISLETGYSLKKATHLIQRCDSSVVQMIKYAWSRRHEVYKVEMVTKEVWEDA